MHGDVFTELSLVIVIAAVVAMIMRFLRQPLIMGYILTGILVGPSVLQIVQAKDAFDTFSEIGIALLLFIIGLELSASVVKKLGKSVVLTALSLLLTIGTLGFLITTAFGFNGTEAILAGFALFFSSTIIIAKVLSDKRELNRLNGQIAIGVILIDDIIATFALLYVAAQTGEPLTTTSFAFLILKGLAFIGILALFGTKILPKVLKYVAKSQEQLFLFALAWGFGVASLMSAIGFSIEVGALFAGVALAHLPYAHQIGARLKPLRDFFIILFFISLGERLQLNNLASGVVPALVLSFVVLIVKPLAVMISLGFLGYTRRTSFKAGINLSQISEFSIILIVLAAGAGLVDESISAIITLVAIITIAVSTYLMKYDNWIYAKIEERLRIFERKNTIETTPKPTEYASIIFGYANGGEPLLHVLKNLKQPYLVVDYNPESIAKLQDAKAPYIYGDITDVELLDEIPMDQARLIINTTGDHAVNMALVRYIMHRNKQAALICYSQSQEEADELYKLGATYVVLIYMNSSHRLSEYIKQHGMDKHSYKALRHASL